MIPNRLQSLFNSDQVRRYNDGDPIFEEGGATRELYIIQEGCVEIRKTSNVGVLVLAEFKKGDFFGDMALLQSVPRFASAYAKGKTKLLVLKPSGFLLKIRRDPTFAFEMLQQLSFRLRSTNERLLRLIESEKMDAEKVKEVMALLTSDGQGITGG